MIHETIRARQRLEKFHPERNWKPTIRFGATPSKFGKRYGGTQYLSEYEIPG
jgi:hypothetical protein